MKIKETIERDCCDPIKDFKPYKGNGSDVLGNKTMFCIHCGQIWVWDRQSGDMDSNYHPLLIRDYCI